MHLLRIEQSGELYADGEAIDLGQTPAPIVILTAADSEISLLSAAVRLSDRGGKAVRIANLLSLSHPYSVDLYCQNILAEAKMIVIRLLGGVSYWSYGVEQVSALAKANGIPLALLSGDGKPDPELDSFSTIPAADLARLNAYLTEGGMGNAQGFLDALDDHINGTDKALPPQAFLPAGLYWPDQAHADIGQMPHLWQNAGVADAPVVAIVFYRALMQAGDTAPVNVMITALINQGLAPLPLFVASLKDGFSAELLAEILPQQDVQVILNMTSFAVSDPYRDAADEGISPGPFGAVDAPVLQVMLASNTMENWQEGTAGLNPRDLAMHVVLPELDGRITSRAVGFKAPPVRDELTEAMVTGYQAHPARADYVARLAAAWQRLKSTPRAEKRLGVVMANYPNKDSRLANGVGLDTPESTAHVLAALGKAGFYTGDVKNKAPTTGRGIIEKMLTAPSNTGFKDREVEVWYHLKDYQAQYQTLPEALRQLVETRWGAPEDDPMVGQAMGEADDHLAFALPVRIYGHIAVAVQPARGYNIDPKTTYHSPDLPPPHHYLAFYFWLRNQFKAYAVMHMGKHGNLEWLPGKALALDETCFPDAILGPMPHFYPFIVNDPGEGAQAKRRTAGVILDHLTPPMTLADSHGVMAELETQMDEYYEAAGLDSRRSDALMEAILMTADRAGIADDCGITADDGDDEKLLKLDNFLCDLKEMQIRDGLHIFGQSPSGRLKDDLLTAILRIPRGDGAASKASILRALAKDFGMAGFDPLTAERAAPWQGARPDVLTALDSEFGHWRHTGDTVDRLNHLAGQLIAGGHPCDSDWGETKAILDGDLPALKKAVEQCGSDEIKYLLKGLDGGYVPAAPSGAPTRGRPEVLPTGRNFFSVDSRAVPTEAAWRIGWASACALIDRYLQDNGNYPQALVLSAWGTANMRTGGDDIAQALALMGVQPKWDGASRRVTGFDILPLSVLGRPRIDVTIRASGFFRDAFPSQISLVDKVARAVGALDEPHDQNPIAARMATDRAELIAAGIDEDTANLQAGFRVFSAKPGAYGAGLQALIDEGIWDQREDFAEAFMTWSSYGYGDGAHGTEAKTGFQQRLKSVDAIIHNQDNREHDVLDSDDYYQFMGGLSAAVAKEKNQDAPIYMGDHSLVERPVIRSLKEEITRVVRGRASNPKWINGVMRHGYKGAFEISATLDYLFAFAATTRQVPSHLFDQVFEAWIDDDEVRAFLEDANPHALDDMLARFGEALDRDLWNPRRNSTIERLAELTKTVQNKTSNSK